MYQLMKAGEYKGFRQGVRSVICQKASPLLEFVVSQGALAQASPGITSTLGALELLEIGSVYLNDERCFSPVRLVREGDQVRIHLAPRRFVLPSDLLSRIIAENEDSIVVDKPVGLPCDATVDNAKENLLSFLEELRGQRFFLTHRLSPESEGLMLIAKSEGAAEQIKGAFSQGRVQRRSVAFVETAMKIGEHAVPGGVIEILSCETCLGATNLLSEGRTTWQVEGAPIEVCYRLEVEFAQPRPKEVRSFLASCGAPIVGDRVFGSRYDVVDSSTQKAALAFLTTSLAKLVR